MSRRSKAVRKFRPRVTSDNRGMLIALAGVRSAALTVLPAGRAGR
jgi:hypothetical protein